MNDRELDRLIARVNPYGDKTVADLPTDGAEADLLEELMTSPTLTPISEPGRPPRRIRRRLVLAAVAAVTALIALGGVVVPRLGGPAAPTPAHAAELVALADANERVLIDAPGWKISRIDRRRQSVSGELVFRNGNKTLTLKWGPAEWYKIALLDRSYDAHKRGRVRLLGRTGLLFSHTSTDFTTMLPPKGRTFLQIRADLGSERAYRSLLRQLRVVDLDTWLAALPDSVVTPDEEKAVVAQMLVGIPLPKGFDARTLDRGHTTDRYYVATDVAGRVTCAWIDEWEAAKRSGDAAGVRTAVTALQSSREWKVLRELDPGGWSTLLWKTVDDIATGKLKLSDGIEYDDPKSSPQALESYIRRLRLSVAKTNLCPPPVWGLDTVRVK